MSRKALEGRYIKGEKKIKEKDWEKAMEAVIRDITAGAVNKPPPVLQIVIYESSV